MENRKYYAIAFKNTPYLRMNNLIEEIDDEAHGTILIYTQRKYAEKYIKRLPKAFRDNKEIIEFKINPEAANG